MLTTRGVAYQSSFDFPGPDAQELQLRALVQAAIEEMPEENKGTLRRCEEYRQNRWKREQQELRSGIAPKPTWQRTFDWFTFPVEFPVGRAIDEANNEVVNLRLYTLYTECLKTHSRKYRDSKGEAPVMPLLADMGAAVDLLNEFLVSAVELGLLTTPRPTPYLSLGAEISRPSRRQKL